MFNSHSNVEIADIAAQEWILEQGLKKMREEWRRMQFDLISFRDTNTYIIRAPDDILSLAEDQLTKTQTMKCSPYVDRILEQLSVC